MLRTHGECLGGARPAELVDVAEQARVGPEGCQILEEQRQVAAVSELGLRSPRHPTRAHLDDFRGHDDRVGQAAYELFSSPRPEHATFPMR
ncbi:MAG: hypothetical protein ABW318_08635 [Vicinamibacterales bacterium]